MGLTQCKLIDSDSAEPQEEKIYIPGIGPVSKRGWEEHCRRIEAKNNKKKAKKPETMALLA